MTVKYEYLVDGTKFAAVEYNDRFEPVFSWINSLTPESLSLGAFRQEHLPCLVGPAGVGEGKLTAGWDGSEDKVSSGPHDGQKSYGYTALQNTGHNGGYLTTTTLFSTHGFDWTASVFEYDNILFLGPWSDTDPAAAAPIALSQDVELLGRVGAIFLMGNFTVQRWLSRNETSIGGVYSDPTKYDLNEDALAVSAAFRIIYTSRNADGTFVGNHDIVLQKSQRSLSPRLTVGWDGYISQVVTSQADLPWPPDNVVLTTASTFNTDSSPRVRIGPDDTSVDIETDLPALWAYLNGDSPQLYLTIWAPDNGGFHLTAAGESPVWVKTGASAIDGAYGLPIDQVATVALHGAGTKNTLVMNADFVSAAHTPHWPSLVEADAGDYADWHWIIYGGITGEGAPLEDDIYTDQDLALRTVLLPSDLPLSAGATYALVSSVSMVATMDGSMVGPGTHVVLTTNANLSVLPLHVKVVT